MPEIIDVGDKKKCQHVPCSCQIPRFENYCSSYCAEASKVKDVEIACECGHSACKLD